MNVPSNAVLALIKASRPTFRSYHDKVAFACHGVAAINGLKLIAVGPQADSQDLPDPLTPEVPVDGWNSSEGEYAFRYMLDPAAAEAPAAQTTLLLKCLPVDDGMFVTLLASGPQGTPPPGSLELNAKYFALPEGVNAEALALSPSQYGHLPELVSKIQAAIEAQLSSPAEAKAPAAAAAQAPAAAPAARGPGGAEAPSQPLCSPLIADDDYYNDLMPGGSDPLRMGGPQRGSMPFGPVGGMHGGGMLVGPSHPMFADRLRHPPGGLNAPAWPGHPSGARWDPVAPEGLPGFQPTDFQRGGQHAGPGGPPVHPDIMQPGAGRGVDWDSMYS